MENVISRRNFLSRGICAGCCLMFSTGSILAVSRDDDKPDPAEFTYCGYRCEPDCPLLKATEAGDAEGKKKVFEEWGLEEKHDIEFDPEIIFCHGCKNLDMPRSLITENCTIIPCAQEKGFKCCFQCKDLAACNKELWEDFPQHRTYVLELQQTYFASLD